MQLGRMVARVEVGHYHYPRRGKGAQESFCSCVEAVGADGFVTFVCGRCHKNVAYHSPRDLRFFSKEKGVSFMVKA